MWIAGGWRVTRAKSALGSNALLRVARDPLGVPQGRRSHGYVAKWKRQSA